MKSSNSDINAPTRIILILASIAFLAACDQEEPFDPYVQLEKDQKIITAGKQHHSTN